MTQPGDRPTKMVTVTIQPSRSRPLVPLAAGALLIARLRRRRAAQTAAHELVGRRLGVDRQPVELHRPAGAARPSAHRRHHQGRRGHADQRAARGAGRRAHRRQGRTATPPTSCTCTPLPSTRFKIEPKPTVSQFQFTVDVPGKVDVELHQPGQDRRHHHGAVTDGSVDCVLAHGLGGSSDLPIPYTYALIGAAWALTFTFAVVALAWRRPRFDPDQPGRAAAAVGDDRGRRAGHAVGGGARGPAVRGLGGDGGGVRTAGRREPAARRVLRAAVGRPGGGCRWRIGPVWRAVSPVRTVYRLLPLSRRPPPSAYPAAVGLLARGGGPVRVRLAGARQPRPGFACRGEDLAAGSTWW